MQAWLRADRICDQRPEVFAQVRQRPGGLEQMQLSTDQGAPACLVMTRLALPVGLVFGTKSGDGRPLNPTVMEDAGRHGVHAQDLWAWETSGTAVIEPAASSNPNGGLFTVLCTILVPSDHILLWILYAAQCVSIARGVGELDNEADTHLRRPRARMNTPPQIRVVVEGGVVHRQSIAGVHHACRGPSQVSRLRALILAEIPHELELRA